MEQTPTPPSAFEDEEYCPDCDHELLDHTTSGCNGYTPRWPRLERCPCVYTAICTCPDTGPVVGGCVIHDGRVPLTEEQTGGMAS